MLPTKLFSLWLWEIFRPVTVTMIGGRLTKPKTSITTPLHYKLCLMISLVMAVCSSSCCLGPFIYALFGERTPRVLRQMGDYYPMFLVLIALALIVCVYRCFFSSAGPDVKKVERRALWFTLVLDIGFLASPKIISLFL